METFHLNLAWHPYLLLHCLIRRSDVALYRSLIAMGFFGKLVVTKMVVLFETIYKRLVSRIDALNFDIKIYTFDNDRNFNLGERKVLVDEIEVGYLWLSPDLARRSIRDSIL